jgi:ubiquitin carboxyl-terminal hydrolase L5
MSGSDETGDDWCLIESDPAIFTEMLQTLGCSAVELSEVYSLDDYSLADLGRVHGLIFLFKWVSQIQQDHALKKEPLAEDAIPETLFFAHQVTTNACATQAILSVVLNAELSDEELGDSLKDFKGFTASFPPNLKGVAISSSEDIKSAHNAFSRQDSFLSDGKIHFKNDDAEAFHFVAYIPKDGKVYELDGLQRGPIVIGTIEDDNNWLTQARAAIQERMNQGGDHIKFNLMAVIQDKRTQIKDAMQKMDESSSQYSEKIQELVHEERKHEQWRAENQRRRHNYVPLCIQLLKELAKNGSLIQLSDDAKQRESARRDAFKTK